MAASFAFKDGCKAAKPTLLEPIMEVRVIVPNDYVGDVMGDLNKRRGLVMGMEPSDDDSVIIAQVPQSEILTYIIDLKTMTQAQASFTSKFLRYDEVPPLFADKVIKELNQEVVEQK
jgi:elongation factor G